MEKIAVLLGPVALFAGAMLALAASLVAVRWLTVIRPQRRQPDQGLVRAPARSLRLRLDVVNHRLVGAAIAIPVTLLVWLLVFQSAVANGFWSVLALSAAGAVALGWFALEMWRFWPERLSLLRTIEAESATAPSLNLLMRKGYWVFHDVFIQGRRIAHLVMGARGVFCVESKWREARGRLTWKGREPAPAAEVAFDGRKLQFPGWEEGATSLAEIQARAASVRKWLAAAAGEPEREIPTHAAIAIPRWRVQATHWRRVIVFDPAARNMLVEGAPADSRLDASVSRTLLQHLQRHCQQRDRRRAGRRVLPHRLLRLWRRLWPW